MRPLMLALTLGIGILQSSAADAATLQNYGALPTMEQLTISPDGRSIAYVTSIGGERTVFIRSSPELRPLAALKAGSEKLRDLTWAGSDHLLITASATEPRRGPRAARYENYAASLYDLKRNEFRPLLKGREPLYGVPMVRSLNGAATIFIETAVGGVSYKLLAIDVATGDRDDVEDASAETRQWLIDQDGQVFGRTKFESDRKRWTLEFQQNNIWRVAHEISVDIDMPFVVGISSDGAAVIVEQEGEDGTVRSAISLEDHKVGELTNRDYAEPSLLKDPVTQRIIGAVVGAMSTQYSFFDLDDQRKWQRVVAAFPGEHVELVSWSSDRQKVILQIVGTKSGAVYGLVDLTKNSAIIIGRAYQGIEAADVAPVRAISYAAGDGLQIPAYLTLPRNREPKGLPLIVLVHGGPASRDYPGFDWWSQGMASRGYAVLQPQFRGSDGLGSALLRAGYGEWGRKMQSDLSDGARALAAQGLIDPARVCIVGASYGGYAALAGMTFEPQTYRCGVSVAGISDVGDMLRSIPPQARVRSRSLKYWRRYAGVESIFDPKIDEISPADHAREVNGPILLIHGRDDIVVEMEQTETMYEALQRAKKTVRYVKLEQEDHWLSRSATRLKMLEETMSFIELHNPAN